MSGEPDVPGLPMLAVATVFWQLDCITDGARTGGVFTVTQKGLEVIVPVQVETMA